MRVFLCHASDDKPAVRKLAQYLRDDGFDPWLDEERLLPGQDWDLEILSAVRAADAIIVSLSNTSVNKVGYVQKELRRVLDLAELQPEGRGFVIPVRLEPCAVPTRLSHWQYADLFAEGGYERLRAGLQALSSHGTEGARLSLNNGSVVRIIPPRRRSRWMAVAIAAMLLSLLAGALVYRQWKAAPAKPEPAAKLPEQFPLGMVRVSGGRFLMGHSGFQETSPAHEVMLAPYDLDRLPVTVAQYARFTSRAHAAVLARTDAQEQPSQKPVTKVTWDEAYAYCAAQGKRLPTEAEWEFAARGSDGRLYPWGNQFLPAAANTMKSGLRQVEPVGSRPLNRSPFDVADLSGNVWQWCADDYRPYAGGAVGFPIPAGAKVIRGGSYQADAPHVTTVARNFERPDTRSATIGFRCAR